MMHAHPLPSRSRLAVLIDAENISHRIANKLFEEVSRLGNPSVRRIYGDFSSPVLEPWKAVIARHALMAQHHVPLTTGKNGADIALAIDAMDLLHRGGLDGFCLVSSDSDFTRLARRLREGGVDVHGFGERKTPESLRHACKTFTYMEPAQPLPQTQKAKAVAQKSAAAIPLLQRTVEQATQNGDWILVGQFGQQIRQLQPDFDCRNFGYAKLSSLIRATGIFDIELRDAKMYIRRKQPA